MWKEMQAEQLDKNAFEMIGKQWMLVTAEKEGKVNTMTASWGGVGVMWGKNVAYVVIRPQRYTKEFIDAADTFSLSFLDDSYRKTLNYLGTVSGRNEDKVQKSGLTVEHENGTPYFKEAQTVFLCKKLYHQKMQADCFLDNSLIEKWYPGADYHTLYIVEIEKVLVR